MAGLDRDRCNICGEESPLLEEWVWIDDSGGAWFRLCPECISQIENYVGENCPICQKRDVMEKSEGFQGVGEGNPKRKGCDECRKTVLGDSSPSLSVAWIESED